MSTIEHEGPEPEAAEDEEESFDEFEAFDVQAWAEAYRADQEAQAEHAKLAGVPFH